jgi:hypothetical protein
LLNSRVASRERVVECIQESVVVYLRRLIIAFPPIARYVQSPNSNEESRQNRRKKAVRIDAR